MLSVYLNLSTCLIVKTIFFQHLMWLRIEICIFVVLYEFAHPKAGFIELQKL
jgi:hypothetical protein